MAAARSSFRAEDAVVLLDFDGTVNGFGLDPDPKLLDSVADVGDEPEFTNAAVRTTWQEWADGDQPKGPVHVPIDLLERISQLPATTMWAGSGGRRPNEVLASLSPVLPPGQAGPWPVLGSSGDGRELPNRSFDQKLANVVSYALDHPKTAIVWADDEIAGRIDEVLDAMAQVPKGQVRLIMCNALDGLQPRDVGHMENFLSSVGLASAALPSLGDAGERQALPSQRTENGNQPCNLSLS